MECLKSFNIRINQASLATNSNGFVQTWGTLGQYYFSLLHYPTNLISIYNLQGFKRPDIYGVSVSGYVQSNFTQSTKNAVIEDWSFTIKINGTSPLISGQIGASDGFQINTTSPLLNIVALSKNTNSIMYSDPYTNVSSVSFEGLHAQGKGAQFLNEIDLFYDLCFTFYYKYEGE